MLIVTIFFIVLIIALIVIYYMNKPREIIPDIPKNVAQQPLAVNCGFLDGNTIKPCSSDSKICESCQCSGDPSQMLGCMSCQIVDEKNNTYKNLYNMNEKTCIGEYMTWDNTDSKCILKDGSYCLPVNPIDDISCNPYTGTKILSFDTDTYTYRYKCMCNNSSKFSNIGTDGGDCNYIHLCGINSTENPNNSNNRGLVNKNKSENDSDYYWHSKSDWDPLTDGICSCSQDEVFIQNNMSCLPDKCSPYGSTDPNNINNCNCAQGYVNCADISYRMDTSGTVYYTGECVIPSCIPDPCIGAKGDKKFNYYDKSKQSCVCGDPNNPNNTWTNIRSDGNGFTQICVDVCSDAYNPCGNRGTCYLYTELDGNLIWKIITSTDTPKQFLIQNKTLNKYLQHDLTLSDKGQLFYIETSGVVDENGKSIVIQSIQVFPGDKYVIKIDSTENSYINFKTQTSNNNSKDASIITLFSDNTTEDSDEYKLSIGPQFLSGNVDKSSKVTVIYPFTGTARCKDCNEELGYRGDPYHKEDDPTLLCEGTCTKNGGGCNHGDSSTCCTKYGDDSLECKIHERSLFDWEYDCIPSRQKF